MPGWHRQYTPTLAQDFLFKLHEDGQESGYRPAGVARSSVSVRGINPTRRGRPILVSLATPLYVEASGKPADFGYSTLNRHPGEQYYRIASPGDSMVHDLDD